MQADNQLPPAERRNYKNVFDAFAKITKEDGISGLWRGFSSTAIRAVVLNLAMLSSYDEIKEKIMHFNGETKETLETRVL